MSTSVSSPAPDAAGTAASWLLLAADLPATAADGTFASLVERQRPAPSPTPPATALEPEPAPEAPLASTSPRIPSVPSMSLLTTEARALGLQSQATPATDASAPEPAGPLDTPQLVNATTTLPTTSEVAAGALAAASCVTVAPAVPAQGTVGSTGTPDLAPAAPHDAGAGQSAQSMPVPLQGPPRASAVQADDLGGLVRPVAEASRSVARSTPPSPAAPPSGAKASGVNGAGQGFVSEATSKAAAMVLGVPVGVSSADAATMRARLPETPSVTAVHELPLGEVDLARQNVPSADASGEFPQEILVAGGKPGAGMTHERTVTEPVTSKWLSASATQAPSPVPRGAEGLLSEGLNTVKAGGGTAVAEAMSGMKSTVKGEGTSRWQVKELPVGTTLGLGRSSETPSSNISRLQLDRHGVLSLEIKAWEWVNTRPVDAEVASLVGVDSALSGATTALDRVERLIGREVAMIREMKAETLTVVLKPDSRTELVLQLEQREGRIEALVRCDAEVYGRFQRDWGQLQDSMAQMNVRLLPLRENPGSALESRAESRATSGSLPDTSSGFQRGAGDSRQHSREGLAPLPDSEPSPRAPRAGRGKRSASRHAVQGWESWA